MEEGKGIRGRIKAWRKKRLYKKMDKEIRKLSRTPNNETLGYLAFGISKQENAKIMAREMQAIETVLRKYAHKLSPEDREFVKDNCKERVIAAGVVRQKGSHCEFSEIARFEQADNMFSPSPHRKTFFPNFRKHIEEVKSLNKFKEPDPREDFVNEIELTLQAERAYNIRYNENYKRYLRKNNTIAKNLSLEELENEWIEDKFNELNNKLKDEYERDPELKEEIDKLREKFEYDAQKANCHRLGAEVPAKKASKETLTPETRKETTTKETTKKPNSRKSRTKIGRMLGNSRKLRQEAPKGQGPKPLETWVYDAKTYTKSDKQKQVDEFSTKYPEHFNKAMGNIEREQREALEQAEEFSTKYPEYFNRAMNRAMGNMEKGQREALEQAEEFSTKYPGQFNKAMDNAKNTRKNTAPER